MTQRLRASLLTVALAGCAPETLVIDGGITSMHDAASHDGGPADAPTPLREDIGADTCVPYGCPQFRCAGGVISRLSTRVCNTCTYDPSGLSCGVPCREGAHSDVPTDLCPGGIAHPGDACDTDADCAPGASVDDGWGDGPQPLDLVCASTNTCAPRLIETCNAIDDDADTRIDEGCLCAPALLSFRSPIGSGLGAGGAESIALASDTAATLYDVNGATISSFASSGGTTFTSVARAPGGFLLFERDVPPGAGMAFAFLADDGTRHHTVLPGIFGTTSAGAWGDDVVTIMLSDSSGGHDLVRWAGTPVAGGTFVSFTTASFSTGFATTTLDSGSLLMLVLETSGTHAVVVDLDGTMHDHGGFAGVATSATSIIEGTDRFWFVAQAPSFGVFQPGLVSIDRTTGDWMEVRPSPVDALWGQIVLSAAGGRLYESWVPRDGAHLRTLVLDEATGAVLARTEIVVPTSPPSSAYPVFAASTDAGPRVVLSNHYDPPMLVAPCVMP